ncbi:MAG TPA: TonB family protein [Vicinamibacterales bacterium]|nr:TonB family protein [Vicinamibacterales bacterium]
MKHLAAVVAFGALTISVLAQADIEPARFQGGAIPTVPVLMTAGADVIVSAAVSDAGRVTAVDVLRTTPGFTDAVVQAVQTWRFTPALDSDRKPMNTRVLVEAVARPPSLTTPTIGTPPKDVAAPDPRVPYPAQAPTPLYPVNARTEGTVVVEARVDASGHVVAVTAVRSSPPFDTPALDAAQSWTFRPAQGPGAPASTYAYMIFVFRQPIVGPTAPSGAPPTSTPRTP